MSTELKTELQLILNEKTNKIKPENIKKDIEIFGVTGTLDGGIDTSSATATADDLISPLTAYARGNKISGRITATYEQGTPTTRSDQLFDTQVMDDVSWDYLLGSKIPDIYHLSIYKMSNTGTQQTLKLNVTIPSGYKLFGGSSRFAQKTQTLDDKTCITIYACGLRESDNKVFVYGATIDVQDITLVKEWTVMTDSSLASEETMPFMTPALEPVPNSADRCVACYMMKSSTSPAWYLRVVLFHVAGTTGASATIENYNFYNSDVLATAYYNYLSFSSSGKVLTATCKVHQPSHSTYKIYAGVTSYSTDNWVSWTLKNYGNIVDTTEGIANNSSAAHALFDNYIVNRYDNGSIYDVTKATSTTSLPSRSGYLGFTPSVDSKMMVVGDYLYYISEPSATQVSVYKRTNSITTSSPWYSFYTTISTTTGNRYKFHYTKDFIYLMNNYLNSIIADSTGRLIKLTKSQVDYHRVDNTTASAADILSGKTAFIADGKVTGSMTNRGAQIITPSASTDITIPAGYHNGSGYVKQVTNTIDANIQPSNIKGGISILGITGTLDGGIIDVTEYENCLKQCDIIEGIVYTPTTYYASAKITYFSDVKIKSTLKIQIGINVSAVTGTTIIGSSEGEGETKSFRFFNYNSTCYLDYGSGAGYNRIYGAAGSFQANTYYNFEIGNRYVKDLDTGNYVAFNSEEPSVAAFDYSPWMLTIYSIPSKIYYMRVFDNGVLIKSLIPVLDANNTPALYDLITKTFYR